jgi:hypothetical protein
MPPLDISRPSGGSNEGARRQPTGGGRVAFNIDFVNVIALAVKFVGTGKDAQFGGFVGSIPLSVTLPFTSTARNAGLSMALGIPIAIVPACICRIMGAAC